MLGSRRRSSHQQAHRLYEQTNNGGSIAADPGNGRQLHHVSSRRRTQRHVATRGGNRGSLQRRLRRPARPTPTRAGPTNPSTRRTRPPCSSGSSVWNAARATRPPSRSSVGDSRRCSRATPVGSRGASESECSKFVVFTSLTSLTRCTYCRGPRSLVLAACTTIPTPEDRAENQTNQSLRAVDRSRHFLLFLPPPATTYAHTHAHTSSVAIRRAQQCSVGNEIPDSKNLGWWEII